MPSAVGAIMKNAKTWAVLISLVALGAAMDRSTPAAEAQAPTAAARVPGAGTPEAHAKSRLKAMSDYMAQQQAFSFDYGTNLEVVTSENQKLSLASSGTMTVNRP